MTFVYAIYVQVAFEVSCGTQTFPINRLDEEGRERVELDHHKVLWSEKCRSLEKNLVRPVINISTVGTQLTLRTRWQRVSDDPLAIALYES